MAGTNFAQLVQEISREEGIKALPFSDEWAFLLEKDGKRRFIVSHHFPLNPASSEEVCRDKALTFDVLSEAGIPAAVHRFLPNNALKSYELLPSSLQMAKEALANEGCIVLKDNYGTGGIRVFRAETEAEVCEAVTEIFRTSQALALSPYYHIREEYRAVFLDGEVLLVIRKERAYELVGGEKQLLNWKHNLGQGARGVRIPDGELRERIVRLAVRAASALSLRFASVDIIDAEEGFMILEVNAGVMMEHYSGQDAACRLEAKEIYRKAILKSFSC